MPAYVRKFINKERPNCINDMRWEVVINKAEYPIIPQWVIDESDDYGDSYHYPVECRRHRYGLSLYLITPFKSKKRSRSGWCGVQVKEDADVSVFLHLKPKKELSKKLQEFKQMLKEVIKENPDEIKDWLFNGRFDND